MYDKAIAREKKVYDLKMKRLDNEAKTLTFQPNQSKYKPRTIKVYNGKDIVNKFVYDTIPIGVHEKLSESHPTTNRSLK
jgi:hypothetical protein